MPRAGFVLELEQVSYALGGRESILRGVSLRQRSGEIVIVRGASGSGKSTLLNLIAGVLQPSTGIIRVNREDVAYVPQEIILFDDSIRNNLLFGLSDKTDAELIEALRLAKLDDLIAAQPQGLDTPVGDNGILFSGGERQRLGLARAVLRGVSLLLLDEATSALDEKTESSVLRNLSDSGAAVVLVTHRTQKQTFASRVLDLRHGELVEVSPLALTC